MRHWQCYAEPVRDTISKRPGGINHLIGDQRRRCTIGLQVQSELTLRLDAFDLCGDSCTTLLTEPLQHGLTELLRIERAAAPYMHNVVDIGIETGVSPADLCAAC